MARWEHRTNGGTFTIVERAGRFQAMFDNQALASAPAPDETLARLVAGSVIAASAAIVAACRRLPDQLDAWLYLPSPADTITT